MGIIWQIAWRNLREHRLKSIIIVGLIALGMFLLVLGNSIIDTGKVGVEKSFIKSFSGHILVGPPGKQGEKPSIIGTGFGGGPNMETPATVPEYQSVYTWLKGVKGVAVVDPQVYGTLQIDLGNDYRAFVGSFGVDPEAYAAMFPDNLEIISGERLQPGQEGFMLSEKVWTDIKKVAGQEVKPGDSLKFMAMGAGTKIKNVPVVGVFRFKSNNSSMQELCFMDLDSLRYLQGMVVGAASQVKVKDEDKAMLDASLDNLDSFFGESAVSSVATEAKALDPTQLETILGDTSRRAELVKADAGAWHYILLRLDEGADLAATMKAIEDGIKERGLNLVVVDWQGAAGAVATFVSAVQTFFLILVIIISVVSVIVIMNTMVVSIIERTAEIGTMRALGAQKSYIRRIFMTETFALSMTGGVIGLILASLLIFILNLTGMPSPHVLFDVVFGGKVLHPVLSWASAVQAMVIMVAVGLVSSLYPTAVALKITPIKAMSNN